MKWSLRTTKPLPFIDASPAAREERRPPSTFCAPRGSRRGSYGECARREGAGRGWQGERHGCPVHGPAAHLRFRMSRMDTRRRRQVSGSVGLPENNLHNQEYAMAHQLLTLLVASVIGSFMSVSTSAASSRNPSLDVQPKYPGTSNYTSCNPQPPERVRDEVLRVSSNGSFISRCLRVITREGRSKNFETITGQDGLTFGITDFATDGGIKEFMKIVSKYFPKEFAAAFGTNADNLLDDAWIKNNNAGGKGKKAN